MTTRFRSDRAPALALLAGLAFAGAAVAQDPPPAPATLQSPAAPAAPVAPEANVRAAIAARIKALDSDADGRISAAEHDAIGRNAFARMDADASGFVSVAEIDAMRSAAPAAAQQRMPTATEVMASVDGDGDGQLSAAEHASGGQAMFGNMDGDGDGFITQAEMEAAHAAMSQAAPSGD